MASSERLADIRRNLVDHFNDEELRTLCFDLGAKYDSLLGNTLDGKVIALLEYLDHLNRIPDLVKLCEQLRPNVPWREIAIASEAEPPFKGLQFFDVRDELLFFGREQLTAKVISRLREGRFLTVIGASGSGKSSLIRAGVVTSLWHGESLPGIDERRTVIITPTDRPLRQLAVNIVPRDEDPEALVKRMNASAEALDIYAGQLMRNDTSARMLIVVDQFEELFTLCRDRDERKAFVDNLLYAASGEHRGPTYVLIALRADFYAQCSEIDELREAVAARQEYIGPMSRDELRRAIEEPARRNGFPFEPGLVDLMVGDTGDEPGALPLLSHALLETWKRRRGRTLSLDGYLQAGGVRGAIAKTAQSVFDGLNAHEQTIARRIFLRLAETGDGMQDTRRRATIDELILPGSNASSARSVLDRLIGARLVTVSRGTAEVTHEALIREWNTFHLWLEEDRTALRYQRQLGRDAESWATAQYDPSYLYRGARLVSVQEQLANRIDELSPQEHDLLATSVRIEAERLSMEQKQIQRELTLVRNSRWRAQLIAAIMAVLLLASLGALVRPYILAIAARGDTLFVASGQVAPLSFDEFVISGTVPTLQVERYEVANWQYALCVDSGHCSAPVNAQDFEDPARRAYPVRGIALSQARQYCEWIGRSVPTLAEWVHLTGMSAIKPWPWGTDAPHAVGANVDHLIGDSMPIDYSGGMSAGLYNLIGNVWEWTTTTVMLDGEPYSIALGSAWDNETPHARVYWGVSDAQGPPNVGVRCIVRG